MGGRGWGCYHSIDRCDFSFRAALDEVVVNHTSGPGSVRFRRFRVRNEALKWLTPLPI